MPYGWSGNVVADDKYWFFEPNELVLEDVVEDISGQNFLGTAGLVISGYIENNSGTGLGDVIVVADNGGKTELTDVNGFYELSVPPGWFGTLRPQKGGRRFLPAYRSYGVLTSGLTGQDFLVLELIVSLEGNGHYFTVQDAVDDAVDGDQIIILPGLYRQNQIVQIQDKGITIRSIDPNDPRIVGATVIEDYGFDFDGSGSKRAELQGLTIRGLNPSFSWGVRCYKSDLAIYNCVISGHIEAMSLQQSNTKIIACTVERNGYNYFDGYCQNAINCRDSNVEIRNSVISNNSGFGLSAQLGSNVNLVNCTLADNKPCYLSYGEQWVGAGIESDRSYVSLKNTILWNNHEPNGFEIEISNYSGNEANSVVEVSYSDVEGEQSYTYIDPYPNCILLWAEGNIDADPCFAKTGYWHINGTPNEPNDDFWIDGDYHLKSENGRWRWSPLIYFDKYGDGFLNMLEFADLAVQWRKRPEPTIFEEEVIRPSGPLQADINHSGIVDEVDLAILLDGYLGNYSLGQWVCDQISSPCIDTGDPNSDWKAELWPHGKRINMGVYGGTPQASMSVSLTGNIADLDRDDDVDEDDLSRLINKWLASQQILLQVDLDGNGTVDLFDFALFAQNWFWWE